jgi:hypothetical protein
MSRGARQSTGRIALEGWTIRAETGLNKPIEEILCNVTGGVR